MKKIIVSICTLTLATGAWAQLDRSIKPKPGPAPEIKLGKTESFTLANGMKVFVVENHKLPTISCNIELDIKPELEGDMAGYRDMMSELLLSGTVTRPKDKLNAEIDQMGVNISVSSDGLNGSGLRKYTEKIFELMADIAMNTKISEEELEKTKKKTISELATQKNEPDAMVRNVSAVVNFGTAHPFGEIATEETVGKITAARCTKYYKTYFRPNVAYMAIVGDITMAEVKPMTRSEREAKMKDKAGFVISVFALILAFNTYIGNGLSGLILTNTIKANDTWSFYQAKSIKQTVVDNAADDADARGDKTKAERYRATSQRYESDSTTGEGKKELMAKAQALEAERDLAKKKSPWISFAGSAMQMAIVLVSASIVAVSAAMFWASFGVMAVGLALMSQGIWLWF